MDLLIPLKKDGPWVRFCQWTLAAKGKLSYHMAEVVVEAELEKSRNYLLVYHPHGLWGYGFDMLFDALHEKFGITIVCAGADAVFKVPLLRRAMAWWGLTPVSKESLLKNATLPYP